MTIVEFLLERIDDDEWQAKASLGERMPQTADEEQWSEAVARRVLAECAGKRAIIEEHEIVQKIYLKDYCSTCADWENSEVGEGPPGIEWPCPTLQALAAVYADHPDYQQEWAL